MKNHLKLIAGQRIKSPKGLRTRPTTSRVREAINNILREKIDSCHWLDICSGSGVVACEALQHGARRVLSIESNKKTAEICKSNLISISEDVTHPNSLDVICDEVISTLKQGCRNKSINFIKRFPKYDYRFDFAYIDPPYDSNIYSEILDNLLEGNWMKERSIAICECSAKNIPEYSNKWSKQKMRRYGSSVLLFLIPNLALHYPVDTDSMQQQINQG